MFLVVIPLIKFDDSCSGQRYLINQRALHVSRYAYLPCMAAPMLSIACPAVRMAVPRLLASAAMAHASFLGIENL